MLISLIHIMQPSAQSKTYDDTNDEPDSETAQQCHCLMLAFQRVDLRAIMHLVITESNAMISHNKDTRI